MREIVIVAVALIALTLVPIAAIVRSRRRQRSKSLVQANIPRPKSLSDQTPFLSLGPPDQPVVEVYSGSLEEAEIGERIPLQPGASSALTDLVARALPVGAAAAQALTGPTKYVLLFSRDVSAGLASGKLQMLSSKAVDGAVRATAVGADGKVAGNASLLAAGGQGALAVMAAWQVLAFVTAQRFLSEINEKLEQIQSKVDAIKHAMDDERRGKLLGNLAYLQRLAHELTAQGGGRSDALPAAGLQLEHIERECLQITSELRSKLDRARESFAAQPLKGGIMSVGRAERAKELVAEVANLQEQDLLARYTRCQAIRLTAALGSDPRTISIRLESLEKEQSAARAWLSEFRQQAEGRVTELKGKFTTTSTDAKYQEGFRTHLGDTGGRLLRLCEEVENASAQVRRALEMQSSDGGGPVGVEVTLRSDGAVEQLREIRALR